MPQRNLTPRREEQLRDVLMRVRSKARFLTGATMKLLEDDEDTLYREHALRLRRTAFLRGRLKARLANASLARLTWTREEPKAAAEAPSPTPPQQAKRPLGGLALLVLEWMGRAA